jgi:hypothetical protein
MSDDDDDWTPKVADDVDLTKLPLSGEEGFLLSRIDGSTSVKALTHLTGLPEDRVTQIVGKLAEAGAVSKPNLRAPGKLKSANVSPDHQLPEHTQQDQDPVNDDSDEWTYEYESDEDSVVNDGGEGDDLDDDELLFSSEGESEPEPEGKVATKRPAQDDARDEGDAGEDVAADEGEGSASAEAEDDGSADEDDDDDDKKKKKKKDDDDDDDGVSEADRAREERNYRKLFETELHQHERDVRVKMASEASGATLSAFCFDPEPQVINAVLENSNTGLEHARLIANHHKNPVGLDALARRSQYLRDPQVQRFLLRNNQTSEPVLRKALAGKPLMQMYRLNVSRENSERAKRVIRREFRRTYQSAQGDDKVALIFKSEGRCLNMLIGLGFDSKTVSMLSSKTYTSSILIQNLLRFAATPPVVIQHLNKQNSVRRSQHLRKLILQHPNCPSQVKRGR